ncbi:MAG: hypothetical protein FJY56_14000 [Betaproteobacteria bacterium]|nr:hypothetical protein [Betaproteobacteria bacterium]
MGIIAFLGRTFYLLDQRIPNIVGGARAVDDIMQEMTRASARQQQVIEQVRATVDEVDQVTQQQALLAHAAGAVQSLQHQVRELLQAVSVFRLRELALSEAQHIPAPPQTHRAALRA